MGYNKDYYAKHKDVYVRHSSSYYQRNRERLRKQQNTQSNISEVANDLKLGWKIN